MEIQTFFSERQRFRQVWLWTILLILDGFYIYGVFRQVIGNHRFGSKPMSDGTLLLTAGLFVAVSWLIFVLRLETEIRSDGIYVRFFPFHLRFKKYAWENLEASFVRQYNPIGEFGGWGIRLGLFGKGRAFNVSGNKGIQLVFRDNKKLLIGTARPEEASEALRKAGHLKT